jgi:molecular chaperone DnaK (HSP70)
VPQARLAELLGGKAISTTMNADEAAARGCALMCAMLSPRFQVRDAPTALQHTPMLSLRF